MSRKDAVYYKNTPGCKHEHVGDTKLISKQNITDKPPCLSLKAPPKRAKAKPEPLITARDALPEDEHYELSLLDSVVPLSAGSKKSELTPKDNTSVNLKVIDAMKINIKPLVGKKPTGAQKIDTSNDETIKKAVMSLWPKVIVWS